MIRRVGLASGVLVILALVVVAVVGTSTVRRGWPATGGTLAMPGLDGSVTVVRDAHGIPQIYADTAADLFRAQGFVTAQDRFFEMDLRRHITAGRLAELVGKAGVDTDKVIRTLGWRKVAEDSLPKLAPASRRYLSAYAEGVNAYLEQRGGPANTAVEYAVLGTSLPEYRIERWDAVDSLAWIQAMAWDLRGNYSDEITRARLSATMDPATLAVLYPPYPSGHAPILSDSEWQPGRRYAAAARPEAFAADVRRQPVGPTAMPGVPAAVPGPPAALALPDGAEDALASASAALDAVATTLGRGEGIGSNSWVVAGSRTASGKPLLVNDPHLAPSVPGIWYQIGLHCRTVSSSCPFDVAGFSFSGLPGVVIGHNARVAWGFTNLGPDTTDFYYEKLAGDTAYVKDGRTVPLVFTTETIKVRGGEDVTLTTRRTGHGPIVSDVVTSVADAGRRPPLDGAAAPEPYAVSLAWTGLVPTATLDAVFLLDAATDFATFREAARAFQMPSQNLVYADVDGHIGYQAPGLIPIRRASTPGYPPGYVPSPGWDSQWDWQGYVSFDELPWTLDPADGVIVAANQQVTGAPGAPFLTTEWDYGWRGQRIADLVAATPTLDVQAMGRIQMDATNTLAPALVKALLAIDLSGDAFTQEAQSLLRGWDFTEPVGPSPSSAAAAYYNAVWVRLVQATFDDQLPPDIRADGGGRWWVAMTVLLGEATSTWWDDRRTPSVIESRDEILTRALVQARLDLTRAISSQVSDWSWGKLHTLTLTHRVLGGDAVPSIVRSMVNRGPIPLPGGSSIVDANGWDVSKGYTVSWAPSMRMVVDLADLDASTWVNQTGASGHPYHPNYVDQVDAWATGASLPWPFTQGAVTAARRDELVLVPRG